jgi:NADH-quinone oxidoreductase subunit L
MLIRMLPMLALNPLALQLILAVGIITGLYGGVLACFQTDLKKVLAFSTISQLGLMFAAIGVNAAGAAVFHLTTHAFFKALLFMTAGIIIHSTHTQDMREMGGLARSMPITTIVFSIGSFALAGMVPLSGFFSKDEIFTVILHSGNYLAFAGALLVGLLTALYVVKTWFRVFFGSTNDHASHEGGPLELVPVSVLALLTLALGFVTPHFARLLGHEGEWPTLAMASISTAVLLVGGFIGYFLFSHRDVTDRLTRYFSLVSIAAQRRFYLDWFYEVVVIRPYFWLSHALWTLDTRVIDAAVGGVVALYRLLTRVTDILDTRVIDAVVNAVATVYKAATTLAAAVDTHVIDGAVNTVAFAYRALTQGARRVDQGLIDGAVNGLGVLAQELGKRFRALQNGHIQRYQRLIVGVAVALVLMVVIVFQVFAMKGA